MWIKRAEYLKNESDTVKMVLDQGFGDTKLVNLRLLGVYAPEIDETGGKECQAFISKWFSDHGISDARWEFIVTTIEVKDVPNQYVAVVTDLTVTSNLNAELSQFIHENGYNREA